MKIFRILLLSLGCTLLNTQAFANEEEATDPASSAVQPGFAYHALDPDIITNYLGDGKTLGYVRVTVELMATDAADLKLLEQHDPLIRDAIIRLIGSKTGTQIKSLVNREELRKECEAKVNELLVKETGKKAVRELIFTKYLYQ
ncbi:flagellar basal body-associated FliL family protein [Aeromonas caviae]|uniref:flagellar basal body-associated FliL family protein n=1 Tax=Aeromonas caviae TaxID=648 RepID=UPI00191D852C|nr:flagellar basal body-associated FliL family protein [Aeromonas caviae]MBL0519254.1 flagellar basal body-associated protein FliL [Aeromonas caviae]